MKGVNTLAKIFTKILEITHWVAAGLMTGVCICSIAAPQFLKFFTDVEDLHSNPEISVYGFEVNAADPAGWINLTSLFLFGIGAVVIFILMALIFRNLNLIIKRSENSTPFSPENILSLKKIGIFAIAVPAVGLLMSIIIRMIIGVEATEISINLEGFILGIIVLCLTRFFIHGAELEKDVDGLL